MDEAKQKKPAPPPSPASPATEAKDATSAADNTTDLDKADAELLRKDCRPDSAKLRRLLQRR